MIRDNNHKLFDPQPFFSNGEMQKKKWSCGEVPSSSRHKEVQKAPRVDLWEGSLEEDGKCRRHVWSTPSTDNDGQSDGLETHDKTKYMQPMASS